jgi:hypothetical protein
MVSLTLVAVAVLLLVLTLTSFLDRGAQAVVVLEHSWR